MLEHAPMPIQSQPGSRLHSRPIPGLYAPTDLTALAFVRLSVSTIQGITVHSTSSRITVSIYTPQTGEECHEDQETRGHILTGSRSPSP